MAGADTERKLTAIVAIDAAGFSARTLADQAGTAADIAALRTRITEVSARFGGRLFNSAGDGFMLEFGAVSAALLAAEELAENADLPIRVGVHLGEVQVTATGDLLGHGVNVAARIQSLASPGSVLVSSDIRRAVRGAYPGRFIAHGSVRLDMMDETVAVFTLTRADVASRARLIWRRLKAPLAAAILVILAAGGAVAFLTRPAPVAVRVAILPFEVLGDQKSLNPLAARLADDVGGVLAQNQVQTVSRSQVEALPVANREAALAKLGVTLFLAGAVQGDGETTHVSVHLDDAREHVTLWNREFSHASGASMAIEGEVAAATTNVVLTAIDDIRYTHKRIDMKTMSGFLRSSELLLANDYPQAHRLMQQLAAQESNLIKAHSELAIATMGLARQVPADQAPPLLAEAKREAERAIQLDPDNGEGYLALAYLRPRADWQGRESLLLKGAAADPNWPFLPYHVSKHLVTVGRLMDALPADERGLALMPFHPGLNAQRAIELVSLGRLREARESVDRIVELWPTNPWSRPLELWLAAFFGPPKAALSLVDDPRRRPADLDPAAVDAWRKFIKARQSGDRASGLQAIKDITDAANVHAFDRADAVQALSLLGDIDGAFEQFTKYADEVGDYHRGLLVLPPSILFYPTTVGMRRDPRFMPFAAKLGLVDYWRATNKWPDFCAEPGLPYDCRKMAARAANVAAN